MKFSLIPIFLVFIFSQHLNAQVYNLNGDATYLGDDCYELTPELANQNGTVWFTEQIDLNNPFDLEFTMNFGIQDVFGADGVVFVLQTAGNNAIGFDGEGMGFLGFLPSFGIEFDTYQNSNLGDLAADHIAFQSQGNVNHNLLFNLAGPVNASAFSDNIEDGQEHIVRVVWDPEVQDVEVWFDCELRLISGVDLIDDIFNGESLVWWGFTAATGGAVNSQRVCLQENILSVGEEVQICPGTSVQLSTGGDPSGIYTWSPEEGLDDPLSNAPTASPSETTMYIVEYSNLCGGIETDSILVSVEEINVDAFYFGELSCNQETLQIEANSNFDDASFFWETTDGNIISGQNSSNVFVDEIGFYTVTADLDGICESSFEIEATGNFETNTSIIADPLPIDCVNSTVFLEGDTDAGQALLIWSSPDGLILDGADSLNPEVGSEGTYTLTIVNIESGCESNASVTVENNIDFPNITILSPDSLSCSDPLTFIDASLSDSGSEIESNWVTVEGNILDLSNLYIPLVDSPGMYYFTLSNTTNGCVSQDSVFVPFDGTGIIDFSSLAFPNVFTPNGDAYNELLLPILLDNPDLEIADYISAFDLKIFNRWGNLIFESVENEKYWNGNNNNGEAMAAGTYFYILKYDIQCGELEEQESNGYVVLVK